MSQAARERTIVYQALDEASEGHDIIALLNTEHAVSVLTLNLEQLKDRLYSRKAQLREVLLRRVPQPDGESRFYRVAHIPTDARDVRLELERLRVERGASFRPEGLAVRRGDDGLFVTFSLPVPGDLPIGGKKRLELARALAARPKLLMLDEVMAGLTSTEVKAAVELIRQVRANGVTLLIVEHIMEAIMPIADKVVVLDGGMKIAEAPPEQVTTDPRVISAYLGAKFSRRLQARREERPHV